MNWNVFVDYLTLAAASFTAPITQFILDYREAKREGKNGWTLQFDKKDSKPDKR
jgi:hypothetical protein